MAKMSTTTMVLIAAAVGGAVYFVASSSKAKKSETKKVSVTGGGPPPSNGSGSGGSGGTAKQPITKAPPFPAANVAEEKVWVDQIYGEWAGEDIEADAAAIKNNTLTLDGLTDGLTDVAFVRNYPTWTDGPAKFPNNWKSSSEWVKWADAWNRMNTQMVALVSQALSQYGV